MKTINKLKKFFFGKRKNSGFTIAEAIVAIAVISIVSLSVLTIIGRSSTVYKDSLARRDARILANNSLYAFQSTSSKPEFEAALSIASTNGFTPDEVNDELTYEASNLSYSFIKKDANNKTVSVYDAAGNVIASLNYSNATNWDTCTNHLLLSYSTAKISDLYYSTGESYGDGYLTAAINFGESGNVILKLSRIAIVEFGGNTILGREPYYKITEQPENVSLYYSDAEGCFYGSENNKIYKYIYDSYPRTITTLWASSNYPGFLKEETTLTDIPESCRYTKQTLSTAGTNAFNLIESHIQGGNGTGSGTIAYEGDVQYVHPTATSFAAILMDKATLSENLVDDKNISIISKTFKSENDFANCVLELNESDLIEDEGNTYNYTFDYKHTYTKTEWVTVPDYKNVTITGTATISKYTKQVTTGSGKNKTTKTYTYYKLDLPFKNGNNAEGTTLTYDNSYESVSSLKSGSAATMASDIAKRNADYIQTSGNYTASLKLGNDKSNQNYTITASSSNLYITAKKSGSSTTYYYNPSTKTYTTTKKAFSSKEARSDVLKGFNTNSSYSYPTPSSTSTTFATFEYTKKVENGSHKEQQEVEHEETLHLSTAASYGDTKIKTTNTANGEVMKDDKDSRIVNEDYSNINEFIAAQRGLKSNRTFVPSSKYRFINESIFEGLSITRNASGGAINFLDKKGSTIYTLNFYTTKDLNDAIALIKTGTYKARYKYENKYIYNGDNSNFKKGYTYIIDDSAKTIYDEASAKYLKAAKQSMWSSTITYSWQSTPYDLGSYYSDTKETLTKDSTAIEHYIYTGSTNESITVKALVNLRTLIFYTNATEIFSWTFEDESSFNNAISTYKSSYESTGNGYVCTVNGYTLTISISFTQGTFNATVTDPKGKEIYKLNYTKG